MCTFITLISIHIHCWMSISGFVENLYFIQLITFKSFHLFVEATGRSLPLRDPLHRQPGQFPRAIRTMAERAECTGEGTVAADTSGGGGRHQSISVAAADGLPDRFVFLVLCVFFVAWLLLCLCLVSFMCFSFNCIHGVNFAIYIEHSEN